MHSQAVQGGFTTPPIESARAFRSIMNAMAKPGQIFDLIRAVAPAPFSQAAATVVLTLCDPETPIALLGEHNTQITRDWVTFHTGAPITDATGAKFVFGTWTDMIPLDRFAIGDAQYPDRSASLIVDNATLENRGSILSGPGIQTQIEFSLPDTAVFKENARLFPLGLDFLFCSGNSIAGLPRSTKID